MRRVVQELTIRCVKLLLNEVSWKRSPWTLKKRPLNWCVGVGGLVGGWVISAVLRYSHTQSLLFRYFSLFCGLETLSVSSSCFLFPLPNPFSSISFFCFLASSLTLVRLPSPPFLPLLFFPLSCSLYHLYSFIFPLSSLPPFSLLLCSSYS